MSIEKNRVMISLFFLALILINLFVYIKLSDLTDSVKEINDLKLEISELKGRLNEITKKLNESDKPPVIIIRIDDVRDYEAAEATRVLIQFNRVNHVKMNLAIIPAQFGSDNVTLGSVRAAVMDGSEVVVHGYDHENFKMLSIKLQVETLRAARDKLLTLNLTSTIFAPPFFTYDEGVFDAMRENGFDTISGYIDTGSPMIEAEGIYSIPVTVTIADYVNSTWLRSDLNQLVGKVNLSVGRYGYAMILVHPQEFIIDGRLDTDRFKVYSDLIREIQGSYSFNTIFGYRSWSIGE
jgi:predicted deacetylase